MFLYRVGYTSYEECPQVALCHERRIDSKEFEEMCLSCAVDAAKEMIAKDEYVHNFSHLYDRVVYLMVVRHGFAAAEYAGDFRPFGWPSVFDKDDWEKDRDEDLDKLTDRLLAAGLGPADDSSAKLRLRRQEERESESKDQPS
jgi:hypothetical protein